MNSTRYGGRNAPSPKGHRWEVFARAVISEYGGLCHLCGHGGARQVDHLESIAEHPEWAFKMSNCRPAHGSPGNACPQCTQAAGKPVNCNQIRGALSIERARRLIAERTAAGGRLPPERENPPVTRNPPATGNARPPEPGAGRPW
jgi:hypothetical protein